MKCPKCGYLGYQDVERCRNCGHEFTMVSPVGPGDLRLRNEDPPVSKQASERNPLDDLELIDNRMAASAQASEAAANLANATGPASAPGDAKLPELSTTPSGKIDLPLFGINVPEDTPMITKAPPPRPPLSVRRATPEVPRLRSESRMPLPDPPAASAPVPAPIFRPDPPITITPSPLTRSYRQERPGLRLPPASGYERLKAGLIDLALLLLVDLVVVYFALKVCRLSASDVALLPKVPLAAFLLLQNGGYLIAFTATGQTLGKMATGLRVVGIEQDSSPGVGRATLRALLSIVLAIPAGLGLLPGVLNRDGRGLNDRLVGTRVVRSTD